MPSGDRASASAATISVLRASAPAARDWITIQRAGAAHGVPVGSQRHAREPVRHQSRKAVRLPKHDPCAFGVQVSEAAAQGQGGR